MRMHCPSCKTTTDHHTCETGDPGCWHCSDCYNCRNPIAYRPDDEPGPAMPGGRCTYTMSASSSRPAKTRRRAPCLRTSPSR
jgi:hypothetical protein